MTCIHIIDDDSALRDSLAALIATWPGYTARTWATGTQFLNAAPALEPGVLLLDHDMPGATGLDVIKAVADDPRFAVVMMTGGADIRLTVEAFRAGALQLIEKPCDPGAIRIAISEAAARIETAAPMLAARARLARLSPRERDVVAGMVDGASNKIIAYTLAISPRTVEIYRANLMAKLRVQSLSAVIRIALTANFERALTA